ncbi:MAG TPA: FAD/NAD(P)-binding protein, partial [Chitinophagales bacterium]|nr:FAD/NAD(P)-binding protein [Chitinophagales bacterium]
MHHVTIVGGGFSGVLTAVQVMRECKQTVFIFLVNKDFPVARGAAYSTESSSHLLNVRACNMSAFPDDQDHLVKWLSGQAGYAQYSPEKISELFIPRKVYGNYLDEVFNIERVKFHLMGRGRLTLLNKEATGLRKTTEGYAVSFSDETELFTHQVILATGNTAPYLPVELETIRQHARYIAEPWKRFPTTFLNDNTADVFILGSGLSMVDAFISLEDAGWKGTVYTTSQHGLFPAKHHQLNTRRQLVEQDFLHCTLQEVVNIYRQLAEQAAAEGSDPLLVLDQLRPVTQYLWKHFSAKDKRR